MLDTGESHPTSASHDSTKMPETLPVDRIDKNLPEAERDDCISEQHVTVIGSQSSEDSGMVMESSQSSASASLSASNDPNDDETVANVNRYDEDVMSNDTKTFDRDCAMYSLEDGGDISARTEKPISETHNKVIELTLSPQKIPECSRTIDLTVSSEKNEDVRESSRRASPCHRLNKMGKETLESIPTELVSTPFNIFMYVHWRERQTDRLTD